jgi:hypothetical protein
LHRRDGRRTVAARAPGFYGPRPSGAAPERGVHHAAEEIRMSDKSPRQSASKKSGKSIKQKRAEKKSAATQQTIIPTRKDK